MLLLLLLFLLLVILKNFLFNIMLLSTLNLPSSITPSPHLLFNSYNPHSHYPLSPILSTYHLVFKLSRPLFCNSILFFPFLLPFNTPPPPAPPPPPQNHHHPSTTTTTTHPFTSTQDSSNFYAVMWKRAEETYVDANPFRFFLFVIFIITIFCFYCYIFINNMYDLFNNLLQFVLNWLKLIFHKYCFSGISF